MSTFTDYAQLRAYWWNACEKRNTVTLRVRDFRPLQSEAVESRMRARLAAAKAKLEGRKPEPNTAIGLLGERYVLRDTQQNELPIFLRRQAG